MAKEWYVNKEKNILGRERELQDLACNMFTHIWSEEQALGTSEHMCMRIYDRRLVIAGLTALCLRLLGGEYRVFSEL